MQVLSETIFDKIEGLLFKEKDVDRTNGGPNGYFVVTTEGHAIMMMNNYQGDPRLMHIIHIGLRPYTGNTSMDMTKFMTTLPNDLAFPCLLVTPYMRGSSFCFTPANAKDDALRVCHVEWELPKNDDLSKMLYSGANMGGSTLMTWGPEDGADKLPQYRRGKKTKSKHDGVLESDRSTIIGVYQPDKGWKIYAQVVRREPKRLIPSKPGKYKVVEVWRLWPSTTQQQPVCLWPPQ